MTIWCHSHCWGQRGGDEWGIKPEKEKYNRCVEHGHSHTSDWMVSVYRERGSLLATGKNKQQHLSWCISLNKMRTVFVTSIFFYIFNLYLGFPGGSVVKESTCQCRRHKRCRYDPWVQKIPWSRKWQPTPVFLPGEYRGAWQATVQKVGHD